MILGWIKKSVDVDVLRDEIIRRLGGTGILLETLTYRERNVIAVLFVPVSAQSQAEEICRDIEQGISQIPGVRSCRVILTSEKTASSPLESAVPLEQANLSPVLAAGVRKIIAVASGKGGVGKSTVAVNLAATLAQSGLSVGVLDADIYGPSVPTMMGVAGVRPDRDAAGKIMPIMAHGMKCMSIGFLTDPNAGAVVWRGPMVQSAIIQMLRDVDWAGPSGILDVLVIDLPPGTGDASMAVAQKLKLTGAVIVSTPQDVALIDAEKALQAFQKLNVPILGLIENMSIFCCPNCGQETAIFGANGARDAAARWKIPFLGALPLDAGIRTAGDTGTPIVLQAGAKKISAIYKDIGDILRKNFG